MKHLKKQAVMYLVYMVLGLVMLLSALLTDQSSILTSMGTVILVICPIKLIQLWRVSKDPEKLRLLEVSRSEERLLFISEKSSKAAFACGIGVEYIAMLAMAFLRNDQMASALGFLVCAQLLAYVAFSRYYSKKY